LLRLNPESCCVKWKDCEGGDMEGRIQNLYFADTRAASRMYFFFYSRAIVSPNFESKNLIHLTWDHVRSLMQRGEGEILKL